MAQEQLPRDPTSLPEPESWYSRWQKHPRSSHTHWGVLAIGVLTVLLLVIFTGNFDSYIPASVSRSSRSPNFTAEGVLEIFHADDFERGQSQVDHFLKTDDGKQLKLHFAEESLLSPQARIRVRGSKSGDTISVVEGEEIVPPPIASPSVQALTTQKKVAIVLMNFQDLTTQPITAANARAVMFTNTNSARKYFQETSFNQVNLVGKISPDGDVYGWYTIPYSSTGNCSSGSVLTSWANAANAAATQAGVDLSGYDNIQYAFPSTTCSGFAGWAYFSNPRSWINLRYGYKVAVVAHELGHNFGAHHASSYNCTLNSQRVTVSNTCTLKNEYGDHFDVMGTSNSRQMNNYHKGELAWFQPANTLDVLTSGTYTIEPIEPQSTTGVQALRIRRDAVNYFYLEFRQPFGIFDNFATTNPAVTGVTLRLAPSYTTFRQSWLLDATPGTTSYDDAPLAVGQTVTDVEKNITIRTVSVTPAGATVEITMPTTLPSPTPSPSTSPTPSPTASPSPSTTPSPSPSTAPDTTPPALTITNPQNSAVLPEKGSVKFDATATDPSGIKTIDLVIDGTLVKTCTAVTTCSYNLNLSKTAAGQHTLQARAADNAPAANTSTQTITVTK